ncbi:MAG: peptide chain release factor 1 [Candidatus Aenigmarchaeota archaeon]|nr:peptide chain release factor 1 [Candidatus Aenigmarchaeota archaeon]
MPEEEHAEVLKSKFRLKKLAKELGAVKGRHTELVTVYVPVSYPLAEMMNQLRSEQSTAENIKSKQVKKNVVGALEKIMRHLQLYRKTPDNGLAVFCGNVSQREGEADIRLIAIEPPEPVKVKMYWCDQKFVLEPLMEMVEEKEVYGIICLDRSEADIALLVGKKIEPFQHFESIVPGKTRAGGQSSARFSRVREGLLNDWLKHVAEASNKFFEEHKNVIGIFLSGSGPVKDMLYKEDFLHADVKKKILGTVDTSYTGDQGLEETIQRGENLIKEASVFKEKKVIQRVLTEMQKPHGLALYKLDDVLKALEMGAVEQIIVNENNPLKVREYLVNDEKKEVFWDPRKPEKVEGMLIGEKDLVEYLEERAADYGTSVVVVTSDTREGVQFEHLGGLGAILRYNI